MSDRSRNVTVPKRGRGRPNDYPEVIMIRAPAGTRARLEMARVEPEKSADVIRAALANEFKRRQRRKS